MILPYDRLHRHDSESQNLSTTLPARCCHALQRAIGWELSYTWIVTSWSQRQPPKNDGLVDRWGSTSHAYGLRKKICHQNTLSMSWKVCKFKDEDLKILGR